jgi:hypothetical protein
MNGQSKAAEAPPHSQATPVFVVVHNSFPIQCPNVSHHAGVPPAQLALTEQGSKQAFKIARNKKAPTTNLNPNDFFMCYPPLFILLF